MTYFNLDYDFKDLENNDDCKIYLPDINRLTYFNNISTKTIKFYYIKENNETYRYSTSKTVNILIHHFKELNNILDKEIKNKSKNNKIKIYNLYLKSLFNIYEKNIEILLNDVKKFVNEDFTIKQILIHKFKFKDVIYFNKLINIECSFSKLSIKNYDNIYSLYDYITFNDKIQDMLEWKQKKKKIENEKLKIIKNNEILIENQQMYMNDPYILNLKIQCYYPTNLVINPQYRIFFMIMKHLK